MPFIKELNKDFYIENDSRIVLDKQYLQSNRWRFKKATGSRFSGLLGKSSFNTPFKTWCQVVGIYKEDMDQMRAKAGIVVEPKVRDYMSKALNIKFKSYDPKEVNWDVLGSPKSIFGGIPDGEPIDAAGNLNYSENNPMIEIKTIAIDKFVMKKVKGVYEIQKENGLPLVKPNGQGLGRLDKLNDDGSLKVSEDYKLQLGLYLYLRKVRYGVFAYCFITTDEFAHPEKVVANDSNVQCSSLRINDSFKKYLDQAEAWYKKHVDTGISPEMTESDRQWLKEVELVK